MPNQVLARVSLVMVALSFQLHTITMAVTEYSTVPMHQDTDAKDGSVKALLIVAYVLLIVAVSLLLIITYDIRNDKIIVFITSLIVFLAVLTTVMGLAIHGDHQRKHGGVDHGTTTTFVTGAVSAFVGGILLLVSLR